jgi:hypothetical protein
MAFDNGEFDYAALNPGLDSGAERRRTVANKPRRKGPLLRPATAADFRRATAADFRRFDWPTLERAGWRKCL